MATQLALPSPPAASRPRRSTSGSSSTRIGTALTRRSSSKPLPASGSRRSADLAGRAVALSASVPTVFDAPLGPHHKLLGRWVASMTPAAKSFTRRQARTHIERVFRNAVLEALEPVTMADLRVVILDAQDERPPAAVVTCESLGQLELGWIETSEAPIPWRAAAYRALESTLGCVLPVFAYQDLFDEISLYYWEGEATDEAARQCQIEMHGVDPEEVDEDILPSALNERRPAWMLASNAACSKELPSHLRRALAKLRAAHRAVRRLQPERNAWHFIGQEIYEYMPGAEDCSSLPPLTLVPVEQFAREIDDIARPGMEYGFMDVAGLCPLFEPGLIDPWFASLRVGVDFLIAAQELIQLEPHQLVRVR